MTLFLSTRGGVDGVPFSLAMEHGLAPDGGLYVPDRLPRFSPDDFSGDETIGALAATVLAPFFDGDVLADRLPEICRQALSFPIPLVYAPESGVQPRAAVLELFHGPTAAFKDVGAQFLAACFANMGAAARTVLVATSGDTGGAVAAAFHGSPSIEVGILFPKGGVSAEQQHQLTCWGDNVRAFAVRGTFDDCQRVLKATFADDGWRRERRLTTANSINIGRLLPQVIYYVSASLQYLRERGEVPAFIVPCGNVGNATAALWAKRMGFPIREVFLATNRNRTVPDYLATGVLRPRSSERTLANAMDVGDPSNMERVLHLYPTVEALREDAAAAAVDDAAIGRTIGAGLTAWGRVFDPHTATAAHVLENRPELAPAVVVATAHPAKFKSIVEPRIGEPVDVPPALAALADRPSHFVEIDPDPAALWRAMG